jgi:hypothetical protein
MSLTRRHVLVSTSAAALTSAVASSAARASKTSTASPSQAGSTTVAQAATQTWDKRPVTEGSSTAAMARADELLRQMTIEEKAMQLSSVFPLALFNTEGTNRSQLDAQLKNGIGHVSALGLIGHKTPEALAKAVNAIQRYLVTETRLKIPAIFHNEAMSGVVAPHFTAFPTSIGLAATWDPAAVEEMADIIRRQMRAVGMLQALRVDRRRRQPLRDRARGFQDAEADTKGQRVVLPRDGATQCSGVTTCKRSHPAHWPSCWRLR